MEDFLSCCLFSVLDMLWLQNHNDRKNNFTVTIETVQNCLFVIHIKEIKSANNMQPLVLLARHSFLQCKLAIRTRWAFLAGETQIMLWCSPLLPGGKK